MDAMWPALPSRAIPPNPLSGVGGFTQPDVVTLLDHGNSPVGVRVQDSGLKANVIGRVDRVGNVDNPATGWAQRGEGEEREENSTGFPQLGALPPYYLPPHLPPRSFPGFMGALEWPSDSAYVEGEDGEETPANDPARVRFSESILEFIDL